MGEDCIIDPVIIDLGKKHHPERPYASDKVTIHVDDARSFVNRCKRKYDLIIYSFLDSHRLLSAMSSVRMENYVYTTESLSESKKLLNNNGTVCLSFGAPDWVAQRIFFIMKDIFKENVGAWELEEPALKDLKIFVAGSGTILTGGKFPGFKNITGDYGRAKTTQSLVPSDDWPFLYVRERKIPHEYLVVMGIILVVSVLSVFFPMTSPQNIHPHYFFLGAGFLLLQTKSITETALLFGATWVTTSVVISAFLIMILFANALVGGKWVQDSSMNGIYLALCISIMVNYLIPPQAFLPHTIAFRLGASLLRVGLPILFSGVILPLTFTHARHPSMALGSNVLGCIVGGLGEYTSLIFGLRNLYVLALIFYVCSLIWVKRYGARC